MAGSNIFSFVFCLLIWFSFFLFVCFLSNIFNLSYGEDKGSTRGKGHQKRNGCGSQEDDSISDKYEEPGPNLNGVVQ